MSKENSVRVPWTCLACGQSYDVLCCPDNPLPNPFTCHLCKAVYPWYLESYRVHGAQEGEMPTAEIQITPYTGS